MLKHVETTSQPWRQGPFMAAAEVVAVVRWGTRFGETINRRKLGRTTVANNRPGSTMNVDEFGAQILQC